MRQQATRSHDYAKAMRRAMLRERFLMFIGGVLIAIAFFVLMLTIGLAA